MKILIEMEVPDDMDPSDVLERMQATALEWHEEFMPEDDEDDFDEDGDESITDAVSVTQVRAKNPAVQWDIVPA